jgi:hypothetical protein
MRELFVFTGIATDVPTSDGSTKGATRDEKTRNRTALIFKEMGLGM